MAIVCLDMEEVLTPENWIAFAGKADILDSNRRNMMKQIEIEKSLLKACPPLVKSSCTSLPHPVGYRVRLYAGL